jgi:multicomponent Na+:H+ antiporter subunit D
VNSLNKALLFLGLDSLPALAGHTAAIGALSVSGIPPTTGFFAKAALIRAGAAPEQALVLTVVAAGSAISILYMARAHVRRFWRRSDEAEPTRSATAGVVTAALALIVLGLGVWPEPLLRLGARAAAVLE